MKCRRENDNCKRSKTHEFPVIEQNTYYFIIVTTILIIYLLLIMIMLKLFFICSAPLAVVYGLNVWCAIYVHVNFFLLIYPVMQYFYFAMTSHPIIIILYKLCKTCYNINLCIYHGLSKLRFNLKKKVYR